jgi:hypothetical protein
MPKEVQAELAHSHYGSASEGFLPIEKFGLDVCSES